MSTVLEQAIRFRVDNINSLRRQLAEATRLGLSDANESIEETLARGISLGMSDAVNKVKGVLLDAQTRIDATTARYKTEITRLEGEIRAASEEERTGSDQQIKDAAKARKESLQEALKREQDVLREFQKRERAAFDEMSKREILRIEKQGKLLEEAAERANETLLAEDKIKVYGEKLAESIQGALEPSVQSISQGLLNGIAKGGQKLSEFAAKKMQKQGGGGAGLQMLARMGPAIAGLVAVVGALAAVMNAAYEQTLQFNQSVLEGSSGIDLMGSAVFDGSKTLQNSLREVREAALDVGYAMRVPAEEVIKTIASFNEAGLTFDELAKSVGNATQAYADYATMAIVASKTLGVSVGEVATATNTLMRDFGMNLGQIEGSFAMIGFAAQRSGMNVKDFFTSVNEASSGMAFYNVKLSESAGLLIGLTDLLGEERAKDLASQKGKFKDQGYQERYKSVMVAGEAANPIFRANFEKQLSAFTETFGKKIADSSSGFGKALAKYTTGGALDPKKLAGLKGLDLGEVQNELAKTGQDGKAAALRLSTLAKAARGASGSLADMADAIGGFDQYSDIAFQLTSAYSVLGDKLLDQLDETDRMAYEQLTGLSGATFDVFKTIANRVGAQMKKESGKDPTLKQIAEEIAKGNLITEEEKNKLSAAQERSLPIMQRLGMDTIKETTNINVTLKNVIAEILEKIYSSIEWVTSWLSRDKEVLALQKKQDKRAEELRKEARATNDELSDLRKQLESTTSDEARLKIEGQIGSLLAKKADIAEKQKLEKAISKGVAFGELEDQDDINDFKKRLAELMGAGPEGPLDEDEAEEIREDLLDEVPLTTKELEVQAGRAMQAALGNTWEAVKDLSDYEIKQAEAMDRLLDSTEDLSDQNTIYARLAEFYLPREHRDEIKSQLEKVFGSEAGARIFDSRDEIESQLEKVFGSEAGARIFDSRKLSDQDIFAAGLKRGNELKEFAKLTGLTLQNPVNDFIYRGGARGGVITPINRKDDFIGMMPGGPIDKATASGNIVNITIEGGDEVKVYNVVRRVLLESGIRPNA
jgi:hypothetical protein